MWAWLASAMQSSLNAVGSFFASVLQFFNGFIYLLEKIVQLAGMVVQVVLLLGQVLASVFSGIIATFQNMAVATPSGASIPQFANAFQLMQNLLDPIGFQILGDALAACVWIAFGIAVISIFRRV